MAALMPRSLNFYSYELFVPRACARDHSPRRSNIYILTGHDNNAKQPMHWTDSRRG